MPGGNGPRRKGHGFEREVARAFSLALGVAIKRGLGQARGSSEVPDVDVPGFHIECKRAIRTNPRAALAQAIEASQGSARTPIAICRDDRSAPFAVLRFEDLLVLLARAERLDAVSADR